MLYDAVELQLAGAGCVWRARRSVASLLPAPTAARPPLPLLMGSIANPGKGREFSQPSYFWLRRWLLGM